MDKTCKSARPELSTLRAFLWTAKTGSTAGAANVLKVSQPAISTAIHKLETIVNLPLFDRSSRPMQLTPAGRVLRTRIEPILEELDNLNDEIHGIVKTTALDLRIGFSDSFGGCVTPHLLPRIMGSVSSVSAYTSTTFKVLQKLLDNKIDIAVATKFPSENPTITGMLAFYEHFLVATPRTYVGSVKTIADVAALAERLPVIRFNDDSLDAVQIERVLRQCNSHRGRRISIDTNQSVLSLVAHNIGWTIIPPLGAIMAKEFLPGVQLHRLENIQATRSFYVMYAHASYARLATEIVRETQRLIEEISVPLLRGLSSGLAGSIVKTPLA